MDPVIHSFMQVTPTLPSGAGGGFVSFQGDRVSGTITGITAHTWVDDANGLYHTTSNLSAEWTRLYQDMIEHHGRDMSLSPEQRMEAQAESVFLHTGLGALPMSQQAAIREDVQREIDAIGAARKLADLQYGTNPQAKLTEATYLQLGQALQNNPQLEELAVQGHGLNSPPLARYGGFTTDGQNSDSTTLYVGAGPEHGHNAVAGFMDDSVLTHLPFAVVEHNGHLIQLDQNGQRASSLAAAVVAANVVMYGKLSVAADFGT